MPKRSEVYDPEPVAAFLRRLLAERGLSHHRAALESGLDRAAVFRFVEQGLRPSRNSCILLSDYFGINPNTLLELAGYTPLRIFDEAGQRVPPEARGVIERLSAIVDPVARSRVISALEVVLDGWALAQVAQEA